MPAYPWGGYSNGEIPTDQLAIFRGVPARKDAVEAAYALQIEYQAKFGIGLVVLEGYRPLVRQKYLRNLWKTGHGNIAAVPGTSIHGWALAFDFAAPLNNSNSPQHKWMRENAGRYGFDWTRGKADNEPWHWEYGNVKNQWAANGGKIAIDNEEDDLKQDERDWLYHVYNHLTPGIEGKKFNGEGWNDSKETLDKVRAIEKENQERLDKIRDIWQTVMPGIENVKYDGALFERVKWAYQNTDALINKTGADVDEAELAKRLTPVILAAMKTLPEADVQRIAKASADEKDKRDLDRLKK
jgi:hypothetical protein